MRTIDIIGVVTQVNPITQINLKNTGQTRDRRNVVLVDESDLSITVSLWGKNAHREDY